MSTDSDLHQRRVSFIACESIKGEGFLFTNPTADYIDAGKLSGPLDSFTFCIWFKLANVRRQGCLFSTGSKRLGGALDLGLYTHNGYLSFVTGGAT